MGLRSYLGLGDNSSSSRAGSAGTRTTTASSGSGSDSGGWHVYDEATAREHHRIAQVSLPPAATDQHGRRTVSPRPRPENVNATFWRTD